MHYVLRGDLITVHDSWQCLVGLVDRHLAAFAAAEVDARGAQPEDRCDVRPAMEEECLLGECRRLAEKRPQ
eukprot:7661697-Lingulodinium_polyedra.AAC.1